ncbi:MAG: G5 domain-containing protein [Clostridia bacterium]|nr:G5 domain-containing protein [Clostridia bacterium]
MSEKIKNIGKRVYDARIRISTTVICLVLCMASLLTTVSGSNTIKVILDGIEYEVTTHRTNTGDILIQSGLEIDADSYIDDSELESRGVINVNTVCNVTVVDGNKEYKIEAHGTVADAISQAGLEMSPYDEVSGCELTDYISENLVITIKRAFSVLISVDGDIATVHMTEGTVADALDTAVITADDDDIISRPLDEVLTGNCSIKITRVEYITREESQAIKFTEKSEKTNTLNKGQSKIKQKGVNGEKVLTYEDKYIDGKLAESTLVNTVVTKKPVEQIKLVGTKKAAAASASAQGVKLANGVKTISVFTPPASLELTENNTPTSYKKKIVGTASAYHCGTRTATGKAVKPGYVAVNPKQIPYHTAMWIVSNDGKYVYGYAFAEDTGGFTKWTGSRATLCDLYMPSDSMCTQFGRRSVTIYIL